MKRIEESDLSFIRARATDIKGTEVIDNACSMIKISIVHKPTREIIGDIEILQFKSLDIIEVSKYLLSKRVGRCEVEHIEPIIEVMMDRDNPKYFDKKYYDALFVSKIEIHEEHRQKGVFKSVLENLPDIIQGAGLQTEYMFLVCRLFDKVLKTRMFVSERLCNQIEKQDWCENYVGRGIYSSEKAMR